jgi:acetolactate synthase-1/3 small subunit
MKAFTMTFHSSFIQTADTNILKGTELIMEEKFIIDLWVNNRFGVLNRITGLYSKRGYNIETIHAGPTDVPGVTKIEIVSTGDDYMRTQVISQLEKLYDIRKVDLRTEFKEE